MIKRRVLVAAGGIKKRALTLETGGIIDDKYILIGVNEESDVVCLLHMTKRELLKNVIDLCEEIENECQPFEMVQPESVVDCVHCESCGQCKTDVRWREQMEEFVCEDCYQLYLEG